MECCLAICYCEWHLWLVIVWVLSLSLHHDCRRAPLTFPILVFHVCVIVPGIY